MSQVKPTNSKSGREEVGMNSTPSVMSNIEITYPTGRPLDETESLVVQQRQTQPARPSSFFFISKKVESLDYIKIINQLQVEKEKQQTYRSLMKEDSIRICCFFLAGVFTAVVGVIVEFGIMKLGNIKYNFLSDYINKHMDGSLSEVAMMVLLWYLGSIVLVMIGSSLIVFIAPFAAGGGVAQCIAYLNGVRVPRVLSIKGMVVKTLSTICCCTSGLAGGKEGPMMHLGAIAGGSLPSALPWQVYKSDHERRDLAAAGFGAGIAVAFGAPIGGLLLAVEEGVSFWDIGLMWKTYLCIVMAYFLATLFISIVEKTPGDINNPDLLTFGKISSKLTEYKLFELGLFALMGAIGGLLGALVIKIHTYATAMRKRFINTNVKKLTESFVVACLVATFSLTAVMYVRNCSDTGTLLRNEYENVTRHVHELYCEKGQYSDMSLMFFQTQEGVIHSMFSTDLVQIPSLFVYFLIYFTLVCLTMGLTISAGLFVPQIVLGAVWGRIIGSVLHHLFPGAQWAHPSKYAYVGATAQLAGTIGKTFSVLVIMVEASGSISFSFPLMVVVLFTKWVGSIFVMPIYDTQMHQMGLPFLQSSPPPLTVTLLTTQCMSDPPLVTLPINPTVQTVVNTLQRTTHNGFPVMGVGPKGGKAEVLLGLILRQQLLVLLKYKAYKYPSPSTAKQMRQCSDLYLKEARKKLKLEKIDVKPTYYSLVLDLSPYYNPYPYTVQEVLPVISTYSLFRSLGLRHIIVLNNNNEPIGMVTRKDLAKYHTWGSFCRMGVKEMIIKP